MNLERKEEWDKDGWYCGFFFFFIHFISLNRYLHACIYVCMYMSMYEYSYFDYLVFHVHI